MSITYGQNLCSGHDPCTLVSVPIGIVTQLLQPPATSTRITCAAASTVVSTGWQKLTVTQGLDKQVRHGMVQVARVDDQNDASYNRNGNESFLN
jgi:hypothetical protein